MGLNNSNIKTFKDLSEAFVNQYDYNVEITPDRDELEAMTQED